MNKQKEDLRVKKTKQSIRYAFLELCKKKSVSKMTVTELSNLAMINKGTFYLHYQDIFALYLEIMKETFLELFDKVDDFSLFFSEPEEFIRRWYTALLGVAFSQTFPFFNPNELSMELPTFLLSELKKRIYAANKIEKTAENDVKMDCLISNLIFVGYAHYQKDPDITVKTMADIIQRNFK